VGFVTTIRTRLVRLVSVAAALAVSISCSLFTTTSIGEIVDNSRNFDGRTVTISGEVTESANLVFVRYYVVKDDTGEIVVVATHAVPEKGSHVRVTGVVDQAFSLGESSVVVLKETS